MIIECEYCGNEFEAERSSARYCCDSHKVLFHRQRKLQDEIKYKEQQRLSDFIERTKMITEAERTKIEQIRTEFEEKMRIEALERKFQDEQYKKDLKRKRIEYLEKKRRQSELSSEKSNTIFKLAGFGILSALSLAHIIITDKSESNGTNTLAKEVQLTKPNPNETLNGTGNIENS